MTRLLYDGKVDVAPIHGQGRAREAFNLEPLCGIMLGANPAVGLREEGPLTNLGKKLSNLSSNSLVIGTFRTAEFRGVDRVVVGLELYRGLPSFYQPTSEG